jgi:hypothetical protein
MKVVRLSSPRTGRLYHPGNIPGTHFCQGLSQPQGHSAGGRIVAMKNSNGTIGNRTRDLPTCSAVPHRTAPPRPPPPNLLLVNENLATDPVIHIHLQYDHKGRRSTTLNQGIILDGSSSSSVGPGV